VAAHVDDARPGKRLVLGPCERIRSRAIQVQRISAFSGVVVAPWW
jgi:hypothetical protein